MDNKEAMDFGQALAALRDGKRVARSGWNGRGMWLMLVPADDWRTSVGPNAHHPTLRGQTPHRLPWIAMKTVDGGLVPWVASQTDLLATDWEQSS